MAVMDESERASTGPWGIAGMEDMMGSAGGVPAPGKSISSQWSIVNRLNDQEYTVQEGRQRRC